MRLPVDRRQLWNETVLRRLRRAVDASECMSAAGPLRSAALRFALRTCASPPRRSVRCLVRSVDRDGTQDAGVRDSAMPVTAPCPTRGAGLPQTGKEPSFLGAPRARRQARRLPCRARRALRGHARVKARRDRSGAGVRGQSRADVGRAAWGLLLHRFSNRSASCRCLPPGEGLAAT